MTLDESSKVGDTLMIPHVQAPIDGKPLDHSKVYMNSPFERRWFSDEAKASWTKNDSLHLHLNSPRSNQLTYRSEVSLLPPGQAQNGEHRNGLCLGSRQLLAPTGASPPEALVNPVGVATKTTV